MSFTGKSTLKGYFNAGDVPTEANFADLVDSCHAGHGNYSVLAVDAANQTLTGDGDALGGIIHISATGSNASTYVVKLPEATTNNIGLSYKVIIGDNAANVRIGPDGTTTKLTGSINVASDVAAKTLYRAIPAGSTHVSLSHAEQEKGGVSGSLIEFFYNSATGVTVLGTVLCDHESPSGTELFGTGDIG